ncbi:DNA polymerase III, subunit gamma and tau [Bartonella elizabethae Re6043vi]|uniref:DNA polymerase III subunit gamma/tau n=2 Tax=Bartonella elizabethae TaxID=807 RepID=J1A4A8_BAREL|nr:DNA polymerase III subunit gamma/tau [Bartonella elizabethae]EJF84259.1 DNA polymerase III, subunit gamma and tau [Bartonella elizabethae Re6043vi]EJF96498.1 DNA polymerase III, subunit gamma and tau [Bartonella elizabethae F9251 = ATCC 49927]VEJ39710.1 DNA polymerase III subunit tau [Bartonella elizabethae]
MENVPAETAYRVLARKYRPQNFSDLIGQEAMVRTLTNAFEKGRIAQAWMLTGIRGVGKTTTARILARALNYKTKDIDQPTTALESLGEHCTQIIEGRHIDVIEMDAASHTGIDDIREIIEQIRYRPVSARYKVYIIDEVHMLSTQAFNGLLKTLEEPPSHVKFIFATTEIRKVPITILSRCQRFDLRRIESKALSAHLRKIAKYEKVEVEDQAFSMIVRAAEGSARDALSIFDQAIAHSNGNVTATAVRTMLGLADQARIIDLFEFIMKGDVVHALHELRSQYDAGADPLTILTELADFNHLVTRLRFTPEIVEDFSLTEEQRLRSLDFSKKLSVPVLSRNWQMLLKGIQEVNQTARPLQATEMLLIRLAHTADLPTLDEALKKLTQEKTPLTLVSNSSHQESINANNTTKETTADIHASSSISHTLPNQTDLKTSLQDQLDHSLKLENFVKNQKPDNTNTQEIIEPLETSQSTKLSEKSANLSQSVTQIIGEITEPKPLVINSLHDIVKLAEQHNDVPFKLLVKEFVHPVSFETGHITLRLSENTPQFLAHDIEKKISQWAKKRYVITFVNEGGGPTLQEESVAIQKTLFSNAETDPDIAKILNHFPEAKIVDIRLNREENDLDLPPDTFKNTDLFENENDSNDE